MFSTRHHLDRGKVSRQQTLRDSNGTSSLHRFANVAATVFHYRVHLFKVLVISSVHDSR